MFCYYNNIDSLVTGDIANAYYIIFDPNAKYYDKTPMRLV